MTTLEIMRSGLSLARRAASAGSLVAALAHYAAVPGHLDEGWVSGVLFSAAGLVQLIWAVLVLTGDERSTLLSGLGINLGILSLYVVTRTVGLPLGTGAGGPEPVGVLDGISIIAEAAVIIGILFALRQLGAGRAADVSSADRPSADQSKASVN